MVKIQQLEILELQKNLMLKACSVYKNFCKSVDDMRVGILSVAENALRSGLNRIWIDLSVLVDVRDNEHCKHGLQIFRMLTLVVLRPVLSTGDAEFNIYLVALQSIPRIKSLLLKIVTVPVLLLLRSVRESSLY